MSSDRRASETDQLIAGLIRSAGTSCSHRSFWQYPSENITRHFFTRFLSTRIILLSTTSYNVSTDTSSYPQKLCNPSTNTCSQTSSTNPNGHRRVLSEEILFPTSLDQHALNEATLIDCDLHPTHPHKVDEEHHDHKDTREQNNVSEHTQILSHQGRLGTSAMMPPHRSLDHAPHVWLDPTMKISPLRSCKYPAVSQHTMFTSLPSSPAVVTRLHLHHAPTAPAEARCRRKLKR